MSQHETAGNQRLPVQRTCKLYIGGKFPRTESGRYYQPTSIAPENAPNVCRASRKDFRNAVEAARQAQAGWASRTAYNRGQILYRIGEMLEGRRQHLIDELILQGAATAAAHDEVNRAIDGWIYYAGWCDKFQQIFSSVNPVASSHFNFSLLEPTGVVAILAAADLPLLGLVALIAPVIASGNSCVVLAGEDRPLSAVTLGEVLNVSDVPAGVINLLTGQRTELAPHFASHMDVNAVAVDAAEAELVRHMQELAAGNMKRLRSYQRDWRADENWNPWLIEDFCEVKTTWHPVEQIGPAGAGY